MLYIFYSEKRASRILTLLNECYWIRMEHDGWRLNKCEHGFNNLREWSYKYTEQHAKNDSGSPNGSSTQF